VLTIADLPYDHIILCDTEFEFGVDSDGKPREADPLRPVSICALDLKTGQEWRQWLGGFSSEPPFPTGDNSLFVAFSAPAEMRFFRALRWQAPRRILDLHAEYADSRNGTDGAKGRGLLDALVHFGLDTVGAGYKASMIKRILAGPPYTEEERQAITEYCMDDVRALARLLPAMLPHIEWKGALLRGRFAPTVAAIEDAGVPIDVAMHDSMVQHWPQLQSALIRDIDRDFNCYDGNTFKEDRFEELIERLGLPWPRLPSGKLSKSDKDFRDLARVFPVISPLRELRHSIGKMRRADLHIGADGRARTAIRPFASKTSRNQPSSSTNIFGSSVWRRGLIKPEPGYALAYLDYSAEEFAVAAALSGDVAMQRDYLAGDPYVNFGIAIGVLPPRSTKASAALTHPGIRDALKTCALAVLYGMGPQLLAYRMNRSFAIARDWIEAHRRRYQTFWAFAQNAQDHLMRGGSLETTFGWHLHPCRHPNPRSIVNYPIQGNAAEILRLACILAVEAGVEVNMPVHDALLVSSPIGQLEQTLTTTKAAMARASKLVLGGFEIRVGVDVVKYPNRYMDEGRGRVMWDTVTNLLAQLEREAV
jgi:DNA polymerase I